MKISDFHFQLWFCIKLLIDTKLFINSRWFAKIKLVCILHWRIINKLCTRVLIPRLIKGTNICHSLTISSTSIASSISSIFIFVSSWMSSSSIFRCHSYLRHPHPHPHPHFIPEHEMISALELGSGFFPQPWLDYYFQEYWSDHSCQIRILVQIQLLAPVFIPGNWYEIVVLIIPQISSETTTNKL
jgi:hypothetical protein